MIDSQLPLSREVVLVGGGHAHALVLRMWGMRPVAGARLTVIDPGPVVAYSGMLPGHVAGHYPRAAMEIDLVRLCRFAGARLILGRVEAIDRAATRMQVTGRGPVAYDIASIDIGVTSEMPGLPGFAEFGVAAKPLDAFADRWQAFAASHGAARVVVIGGGVAGVELALAAHHRLAEAGCAPEVTVIEAGRALAAIGAAARGALLRHLARRGIALLEGAAAARVCADGVELADGRQVPAGLVIGAAGARAQDWLATTGLDLHDGFVSVGPTLQSSDPAIFAAGDCAHLGFAPRPKAGVFAVRAAPVLAANLRAALTGQPLRRFRPQRDYLKLISTGGKGAVADKWGLRLDGRWLWSWKDRIDRRFMAKLTDLPAMPVAALPRDRVGDAVEPLCGGCGSKVGPGELATVLAGLDGPVRADVEHGAGDDAAVLVIGGQRQVITTDHLRGFWPDPGLMARIAAVHALGDVWAMGAAPQAVLAQVILPRMTEVLQAAWLAEIMTAAGEVFAAEGAAIVGGHTTMGAELTLGFTVTGLAERPVGLAGARPGDALILTKPIGSGTILAAEMRGLARGRDVAACLAMMVRPQGQAARLLADAHAMTDVTGFGLAGHLLAICEASGVAAEIEIARVPRYDGADALADAGVRSTIFPARPCGCWRAGIPRIRAADRICSSTRRPPEGFSRLCRKPRPRAS